MKINEINKGDLIALEFMSGECLSHALDIATQDDVEVLQTGTGSSPTIFNIERGGLHGAIFVSHLRNSGIQFDDVSGEGHVPAAMQGKSQIMKDVAAEQGYDLTDLPFTTDLDENSPRISEEHMIEEILEDFHWISYIGWDRDDLDYVLYKNIDPNRSGRGDYRFLRIDKETGSWTTHRTKRNDAMATESGDIAELEHFLKGVANSPNVR